MARPLTLDDFSSKLSMIVEDARTSALRERMRIQSKAAKEYRLGSGALLKELASECKNAIEAVALAGVAELERAIELGLDRDAGHAALSRTLRAAVPIICRSYETIGLQRFGGPKTAINEPAILERVDLHLRHAEVGIAAHPMRPSTASVSNTINAQTIGAVQQGSHNSSMYAEITIDLGTARSELQTLEEEFTSIAKRTSEIEDALADIATIKAQLSKPAPSRVILAEAARSLRSISEGIVAGLLTTRAQAAISSLTQALGF